MYERTLDLCNARLWQVSHELVGCGGPFTCALHALVNDCSNCRSCSEDPIVTSEMSEKELRAGMKKASEGASLLVAPLLGLTSLDQDMGSVRLEGSILRFV